MMPTNTRKRKLPSLDSDSHQAKKGAREEASPLKRKSQRNKMDDKKNCPSPHKSPRKRAVSPTKSPKKSPFKPAIITSSFYGKKKPIYLTPLERKAMKESLPLPPPPPPPPPSPPSQLKKLDMKNKKKKVKGGNKGRKTSAGSKNEGKSSIKNFTTKTTNSSVAAKSTAAVSTGNAKPAEPKKAITITFSSLKPKPKIFVGAAFFSTGRKPTSMYKKSATKSSAKPASAQGKSQAALQQTKKTTTTMQQQKQKQPSDNENVSNDPILVQPVKIDENQTGTKPRAKFDPSDWTLDSVDEEPRSPHILRTTKELRIVLTRTPPSGCPASLINAQDCLTEASSEPIPLDQSEISPTSAPSSPPKEPAAVYPIFGSASKRSLRLKKTLQTPVACSAPSGPMTSLQTPSTKERSTRRRKEKADEDQLVIDAGQKQFGATTCNSCGMVYSADNPEDNFQHSQFHQRFIDSIKFVGWKKERVVSEFWDGKILLVMPDDPKYATKKAEDVRRVADSELGFQQATLSRPAQAKTYLFVNTQRMVVGCLVAEPIRQAFRVLEQPDRQKDMRKDDFMEQHRAWCCSTVPERALCGISRIWVFSLARRKGIATRMLDTVRSSFTYGSHLTKEEVAFSDPTPDGKIFATKYCGTPTFLVYNFMA